jgi:hypothetical protein
MLFFLPACNGYIEDFSHIWRECWRILCAGGILIAALDNGANFLFEQEKEPLVVENRLRGSAIQRKTILGDS